MFLDLIKVIEALRMLRYSVFFYLLREKEKCKLTIPESLPLTNQ